MPAVSVVMPAYNVAPYIGTSIASVCAQTFADWELLIVDDGSIDDTAAIAERFARADPRVRVLRQANGGISAARNAALRQAAGEFIAILDSDDLWLPGFLASQLAIFERRTRAGPLGAPSARPVLTLVKPKRSTNSLL